MMIFVELRRREEILSPAEARRREGDGGSGIPPGCFRFRDYPGGIAFAGLRLNAPATDL
jgi:hypothetical protein